MGEKTTIEIDNIRELKQHALDTNKTLKQLINEAINEKIQRERDQLQKGTYHPKVEALINNNRNIRQNNISELIKTLDIAGLLPIVEKECIRHKLVLRDLSPANISPELLSDIHTAITLVFDDETADQIIQKIEALFK